MIELRAWESLVAPHMKGAALFAIEDAVRTAAIDLAIRSRLDTRFDVLPYTPGEPDALVAAADADTYPAEVLNVWTPCGKLNPRTRREIDRQYPDGFIQHSTDRVTDLFGWIALRPQMVRVVPELTVATTLRIEVAYTPRRDTGVLDDYWFNIHGETIAYGALWRLLDQELAPWYSPERARSFHAMSEARIGALEANHGLGHGKQRLRTAQDDLA